MEPVLISSIKADFQFGLVFINESQTNLPSSVLMVQDNLYTLMLVEVCTVKTANRIARRLAQVNHHKCDSAIRQRQHVCIMTMNIN